MNNYDTIIFDLDGTLLNTLEDLMDGANHALSMYGLPIRSLEEIRRFVGNGIRNLMTRCVYEPFINVNSQNKISDAAYRCTGTKAPAVSEELFEKIFEEFRDFYNKNSKNKTRPYDGIPDLLGELHKAGYKMAIVSNKHDEAVKALNKYYFGNIIGVAIGAKDGIEKKPAPDSVFEALRLLDSDGKQAVYVGDSEVDVKTAENAGLLCIACLWGFRDRQCLVEAGASIFADSPADISDIVLRISKEN